MSKFSEVLKNRNFFLLWIGQIVSEFGERMTQMALIGLVYQKNPYSAVALAKLIIFIVIPVFLIGPIAGAYVDRWNRRYTMIASDILRSLFVFLIPACLVIFNKNLVPVYILVFLVFSITRFFLPSKMAIIPDLVKKEELLIANSLISTTRMIATVVGLGVAGIIVGIAGPLGGFFINAGTFLFSAVMVFFVSVKSQMPLKTEIIETGHAFEEAIKPKIFKQIKEGLKLLLTDKSVRASLTSLFMVMAGLGAMSVVAIVFIQECFGSATKEIGFFGMLIGAGLFMGSLVYGRLGHFVQKSMAMSISFIGSGVAIAAFALTAKLTRSIPASGVCAVVLGIFGSPIIILSNTIIHEAIPQHLRGRIFSSIEAVIHVAFLACMLLAAKAADVVGRSGVLICCAGFFVLFGIVGFIRSYKWKQ